MQKNEGFSTSDEDAEGPFEVYTVKKGDMLGKIALKYHTNVQSILQDNPDIKDRDKIYVGQKIKVRPVTGTRSRVVHTVKNGETPEEIAEIYRRNGANVLSVIDDFGVQHIDLKNDLGSYHKGKGVEEGSAGHGVIVNMETKPIELDDVEVRGGFYKVAPQRNNSIILAPVTSKGKSRPGYAIVLSGKEYEAEILRKLQGEIINYTQTAAPELRVQFIGRAARPGGSDLYGTIADVVAEGKLPKGINRSKYGAE